MSTRLIFSYEVEFDFLGKDSIRYYNKVSVDKQVYKNVKLFKEHKEGSDDLFDRVDVSALSFHRCLTRFMKASHKCLQTSTLNKHLQDQMKGLTAKVWRTYNASITLQAQLRKESEKFGVLEVLSFIRKQTRRR